MPINLVKLTPDKRVSRLFGKPRGPCTYYTYLYPDQVHERPAQNKDSVTDPRGRRRIEIIRRLHERVERPRTYNQVPRRSKVLDERLRAYRSK